ncbi:MAG: acyl--CoA ligase, partial [Chlorobiales bacterium]|nr:acyl--CoA ligase [Chlorobiales bacterium]
MDIVARAAKQYGNYPALITEKETLSFIDLEAAISRVASVLKRYGIRKSDVVAICMPNSPELVLLLLALLRTGSIAAPLNHRFPAPGLQELLDPLKPVALVGPENLTENLSVSLKLDPETVIDESSSAKERSKQFNSSTIQQFNTPITIIHTSSSSGTPKAALH